MFEIFFGSYPSTNLVRKTKHLIRKKIYCFILSNGDILKACWAVELGAPQGAPFQGPGGLAAVRAAPSVLDTVSSRPTVEKLWKAHSRLDQSRIL